MIGVASADELIAAANLQLEIVLHHVSQLEIYSKVN
jgi:hypothetical protein